MKIWFPTIRTRSGSDIYVQRLASSLEANGVQTAITWFPHWRELWPFGLSKAAMPQGTTLVHVNSWHGFPFSGLGVPLLATCHHSVHDPLYKPYASMAQKTYHRTAVHYFERATFSRAACVSVVSQYTADVLSTIFPGVPSVVIPNGIDTDLFCPAKEAESTERFRILYVGNLSRRKGADLLAPIMRKLGHGYELRYGVGLSGKAWQLGDNAVNLGVLSDAELVREYQQCDVVLYPTRYEGFGYVACEAMSCGKPVIVGCAGALKELVVDGVTGLIVNDNDPDSFVAAIQKLNNDKEMRVQMGRACRERVLGEFSDRKMVSRYIELYRQLAGN